jgi:hypothetical protein
MKELTPIRVLGVALAVRRRRAADQRAATRIG